MPNIVLKTVACTCDGCNCITQVLVNGDWVDIVPTVECPVCAKNFCIGNNGCCSDVSTKYPNVITNVCLKCYETEEDKEKDSTMRIAMEEEFTRGVDEYGEMLNYKNTGTMISC